MKRLLDLQSARSYHVAAWAVIALTWAMTLWRR